jgi:uridine phosphorylase
VRVERTHREYVTLTGVWNGLDVTVMATGMGPDNTEIAVVELAQIAAPTLIRIGSSGGLRRDLALGSLVVSSGAVRLENTSTHFVPEGYPALSHPAAALALLQAAEDLGCPARFGLTATAPGFYGAQAREVAGFPPRFPDLPATLGKLGVLNLEMEASALFTLSSLRGLRAGCVCAVYANRPRGTFIGERGMAAAEEAVIGTGLRACEILAGMDARRGDAPEWLPRMGC